MLGSIALPAVATAGGKEGAPPKCADLAAIIADDKGNDELLETHFPGKGKNAGPGARVLAASSVVIPAGLDPPGPGGAGLLYPAHCEVNLKQFPAINIRIGLPLSGVDGGSGASTAPGTASCRISAAAATRARL